MEREEREYVLGTDPEELQRLRFQHLVWVKQASDLWKRAGVRAGQVILDLGCGPGYTSLELAHIVGKAGKVLARDVSARFIAFLDSECQRLSCSQVATSLGPVEELELEPASLDVAYARWLFCWLSDASVVMASVARGLKPGGALILQDYLDWGAMKRIPKSPIFTRVVDACMASWPKAGATIDIGDHIPDLAQLCGLKLEHFEPVARLGQVGSLEWRWLGGFFHSYLPRLVQNGLLQQEDLEAFRQEWKDSELAVNTTCIYAPTMVDVILRKP